MNYINKIVLVFFSLLLVILLILLVINLNSNKYKFAPVISDCPDYWETTTDASNNIVCLNTHNLGNNSSGCYFPKLVYKKNKLNTYLMYYSNMTLKCYLKRIFNACNVTWDGLTNNETLKC